MKVLISSLLKYIVFVKYFERDVLEKLSILKETLQIKLAPSEEGRNPPCYPKLDMFTEAAFSQTFVLFFLISVTGNLSSHV